MDWDWPFGALRVLVAMAPTGLPRIHEIGIDIPVLLFTAGLALLTGLLIGAIPIAKFAGARAASGLREGGRALSQSRERHRARNTLVIVQVGLALVLLICSGLMIRTFRALMHVSPGFVAPESVEQFRFYISETQIPDSQAERVVRMDEEFLTRSPRFQAFVGKLLERRALDGRDSNDILYAQDHVLGEGELPPIRRFKFISPGFFSTLGTRLVAGRDLTCRHLSRAAGSHISEAFAREYWHNRRRPLGKKIRVASTDDWREIVGVAQDMHDDGVDKPAPSAVYWPVMRPTSKARSRTCSVASLS